MPQDHVLIAPAADSVLFNDDNATTATLASDPAHGFRLIMPDHSGGLKFQVSDDGHGGTLLVGIAAADLAHLHHV